MKQLHYLLFLFAISACGSSDTSKESIIDSLITLSKSRDSSLKWINRLKPCVIIENQSTSACSINFFYPIGLKIKIVDKRPEYDDKTFLSVAGAYTTKESNIDGLFINDGILISKSVIIFIGLALLFQPFIKIALGSQIWNIVDVVIVIWLLISLSESSKNKWHQKISKYFDYNYFIAA